METVKLDNVVSYVNRINIDGIKRTNSGFISRQVQDLFKAKTFSEILFQVASIKQRFAELEIFNEVDATVDVARSGPNVTSNQLYDVTFHVREKRRINFSVKTMCSMDNNVNLVVSALCPNLLGRGEKLEADFQHGLQDTGGRYFTLTKPLENNPRIRFGFGGWDTSNENFCSRFVEKDTALFTEIRLPTLAGMHQLRWEGIWRFVHNSGLNAPLAIREHSGHSIKSAISHIFERDSRDSRIFPNKGGYIRIRQELAGLGMRQSDADAFHLRHELELHRCLFLPIFGGVSLEATGATGIINSLHTSGKVNLSDRFFPGGPLNMRGFRTGTLGPSTPLEQCPLGTQAYYILGLHLHTPLPYFGAANFPGLFRLHGFAQLANATNGAAGDWGPLNSSTIDKMGQGVRVSVGCGLAFQLAGIARLELNYVVPLRAQASDQITPGVQFGIGVNYL